MWITAWHCGDVALAWRHVHDHCATAIAEAKVEAPFLVLLGPLAHDKEDPPSFLPTALVIAVLIALASQIVSFAWRRVRQSRAIVQT
jgi:hypothetical protein